MTGMAASVAAAALSARPSVNRNPRRDVGDGRKSWSAHIASDSSQPAGDRRPFPDEPGDDVRDLLRRDRAARDVPAPVVHAEIDSSPDHGPTQMLIAHEPDIPRGHDRTRLRAAPPLPAMA